MRNENLSIYLKKSLFSYGASVLTLCLICLCVGDEAAEISPMFEFGSRAVPIPVLFELAGLSVIFSFERFLFFTDRIIKKMGLVMRTAFLAASTIITAVIFVLVFRWFQSDNLLAWISFAVSFVICFIISLLITAYREKKENKKMEEALRKVQSKE